MTTTSSIQVFLVPLLFRDQRNTRFSDDLDRCSKGIAESSPGVCCGCFLLGSAIPRHKIHISSQMYRIALSFPMLWAVPDLRLPTIVKVHRLVYTSNWGHQETQHWQLFAAYLRSLEAEHDSSSDPNRAQTVIDSLLEKHPSRVE